MNAGASTIFTTGSKTLIQISEAHQGTIIHSASQNKEK